MRFPTPVVGCFRVTFRERRCQSGFKDSSVLHFVAPWTFAFSKTIDSTVGSFFQRRRKKGKRWIWFLMPKGNARQSGLLTTQHVIQELTKLLRSKSWGGEGVDQVKRESTRIDREGGNWWAATHREPSTERETDGAPALATIPTGIPSNERRQVGAGAIFATWPLALLCQPADNRWPLHIWWKIAPHSSKWSKGQEGQEGSFWILRPFRIDYARQRSCVWMASKRPSFSGRRVTRRQVSEAATWLGHKSSIRRVVVRRPTVRPTHRRWPREENGPTRFPLTSVNGGR